MAINLFSSKYSYETRTMYSKSDKNVMMGNETGEIIEELFDYFSQRYQKQFRRINERK